MADPATDLRSLGVDPVYDRNRLRPVTSGLAADRPTVALIRANSFYYENDTGLLWYTNGTTWALAAGAIRSGTAAAKPAAAAGNSGQFYYETDALALWYSNGTAWVAVVPGAWTTYVPAWTATGTAPAIGNGTITGRYAKIGKTVTVSVTLSPGSTSTFGTGGYRLSLPVAAAANEYFGSGYIYDASANSVWTVMSRVAGSVSTTTMLAFITSAAGVFEVAQTQPFTWATSDQLNLQLTYEAA